MPKATTVHKLINDFGGPSIWVINHQQRGLFCKVCSATFGQRRSLIHQHTESEKHKKNVLFAFKERHVNLTRSTGSPSEGQHDGFAAELCEAFLASNIPLSKIEHPSIIQFFEKIAQVKMPSRQTVTKMMETKCKEVIADIRSKLLDKQLFIIADETTDCTNRAMCAVLAGPLDGHFIQKPYLLHLVDIESTNSRSIQQCILSALVKVFGSDLDYASVRLLLTDAATSCMQAGSGLKSLFPNLLHITCVCHGLQRVAESIRSEYPNIDRLISEVGKIFEKAPRRRAEFSSACQIPLPPLPVVTRLGTWLAAAFYYADNFPTIKTYLGSLGEDSQALENAKKLVEDPSLPRQLASIKANCESLAHAIQKLEKRQPLIDSISVLESIQNDFKFEPGATKLKQVIAKNPDLKTLCYIKAVLAGQSISSEEKANVPGDQTALLNFRFAPVTTCDVERTFSNLKELLSSRRLRTTSDHVLDHMIIAWNSSQDLDDDYDCDMIQ